MFFVSPRVVNKREIFLFASLGKKEVCPKVSDLENFWMKLSVGMIFPSAKKKFQSFTSHIRLLRCSKAKKNLNCLYFRQELMISEQSKKEDKKFYSLFEDIVCHSG